MQRNENGGEGTPKIINIIKSYFDLKLEYYQLSASEKISLLIGKLVLLVLIGVLSVLLLSLFMILMYDFLMVWIGEPWKVTLIEMGFILFIILILWIGRNGLIVKPIANMIVRVLYNSSDVKREEEDDE